MRYRKPLFTTYLGSAVLQLAVCMLQTWLAAGVQHTRTCLPYAHTYVRTYKLSVRPVYVSMMGARMDDRPNTSIQNLGL